MRHVRNAILQTNFAPGRDRRRAFRSARRQLPPRRIRQGDAASALRRHEGCHGRPRRRRYRAAPAALRISAASMSRARPQRRRRWIAMVVGLKIEPNKFSETTLESVERRDGNASHGRTTIRNEASTAAWQEEDGVAHPSRSDRPFDGYTGEGRGRLAESANGRPRKYLRSWTIVWSSTSRRLIGRSLTRPSSPHIPARAAAPPAPACPRDAAPRRRRTRRLCPAAAPRASAMTSLRPASRPCVNSAVAFRSASLTPGAASSTASAAAGFFCT